MGSSLRTRRHDKTTGAMEMDECGTSNHRSVHVDEKKMLPAKWNFATRRSPPTLDSLPEEMLLELFSYLDSADLYNLSICFPNLNHVCRIPKLWCDVEDRCNGFSPSHNRLLSFLQESTARIELINSDKLTPFERRNKRDSCCLNQQFFQKLKALPNLKSFLLHSHRLNVTTFKLNYLPESLTELNLDGTHLYRTTKIQKAFFKDIDKILPNLKRLILSNCLWIKSSVLNRIAKCEKLEYLCLFRCCNMGDVSSTFELLPHDAPIFSSLQSLDVRQTGVFPEDLLKWPCFSKLRNIYLQPPKDEIYEYTEYSADYLQGARQEFLAFLRKHETIEGLFLRDCRIVTDDFLLSGLLHCCKSLRMLDVTNTKCSTRACYVFERKHPNLKFPILQDFLPGY